MEKNEHDNSTYYDDLKKDGIESGIGINIFQTSTILLILGIIVFVGSFAAWTIFHVDFIVVWAITGITAAELFMYYVTENVRMLKNTSIIFVVGSIMAGFIYAMMNNFCLSIVLASIVMGTLAYVFLVRLEGRDEFDVGDPGYNQAQIRLDYHLMGTKPPRSKRP